MGSGRCKRRRETSKKSFHPRSMVTGSDAGEVIASRAMRRACLYVGWRRRGTDWNVRVRVRRVSQRSTVSRLGRPRANGGAGADVEAAAVRGSGASVSAPPDLSGLSRGWAPGDGRGPRPRPRPRVWRRAGGSGGTVKGAVGSGGRWGGGVGGRGGVLRRGSRAESV